MHLFNRYDLIIFDCDGVIVDSNKMKLDAMRESLILSSAFTLKQIEKCIDMFAANFGKSRYFHAKSFTSLLSDKTIDDRDKLEAVILEMYTKQVELMYLKVPEAKGIRKCLENMSNKLLFVASGSEQEQLRRVLELRQLSTYFKSILGSPETKANNVRTILNSNVYSNALMVGDAFADLDAANQNSIDFAFYSPLSNVKEELTRYCHDNGIPVITDFEKDILC